LKAQAEAAKPPPMDHADMIQLVDLKTKLRTF